MNAQQYSDSQQRYRNEYPRTGSSCLCASCDRVLSQSANHHVEHCYGFEQSQTLAYSDHVHHCSSPQIHVSDYSWSSEHDQANLAGAQFDGQQRSPAPLPYQHAYDNTTATGSWGLSQHLDNVFLDNLGLPYWNHRDSGTNAAGSRDILDDPLYATALASHLASTNLALSNSPVETSLIPPMPWDDLDVSNLTSLLSSSARSTHMPYDTSSLSSWSSSRSAPVVGADRVAIDPAPAALLAASNLRPPSRRTHPRKVCQVRGCGQDFPRTYELNRHQETEHAMGTMHYHCARRGCDYQYPRLDKVREHCRKKHKQNRGHEQVRTANGAGCLGLFCP
ncbi:hypothetical protein LTR17_010534 [Elasticomyces elasticus]|nr:hypothetical protein LTR17_010534 [Elasticomyces elasticus]